jgi:hypothetical protein
MPRKPVISRLPAEQRSYVEKLLREDRLTLDEMIAAIAAQFPSDVPSRSSLHRYQLSQRQVTDRMKAQDLAARAIVAELGENPDERAGALLVQAVTTAATDVALRMNEADDTTIEDVRKLARAAKDTIQARQSSLKERQTIEAAARERLVREQNEKLASIEKKKGMSPEVANQIRREILGIGA